MSKIANPDLNVVMQYASFVISLSTDTHYSLDVSFWLQDNFKDVLECWLKPLKFTAIHKYIRDLIVFDMEYMLDKHFPVPVINTMVLILENYRINYSTVGNYDTSEFADDDTTDELEEYADQLFDLFWGAALDRFVNDVFTNLFWNKNFLYEFNLQCANFIRRLEKNKSPEILKEDGVLNRITYVPSWLKDAILYRDKCRCSICGCDLSKANTTITKQNFDHIIPLQNGGNNDPSNWQLTCEHCNKSKGNRSDNFTNIVLPFWEI